MRGGAGGEWGLTDVGGVQSDQLGELVNLVGLGLELALGEEGRGEGRDGEGEEREESGLHFGGLLVWESKGGRLSADAECQRQRRQEGPSCCCAKC